MQGRRKRGTIIHVITGLATGGAQRALLNLLEAGLARDYDSRVISLTGTGAIGVDLERLGVPVTHVDFKGYRRLIPGLHALTGMLRAMQPDIIQGWMYHGNLAVSMAAYRLDSETPLVWNIRHSVLRLADEKPATRRVIRLARFLSGRPDTIVYNSRVSKSQHESMGYSAVSGCVIPNGFDLSRYRPDGPGGLSVRTDLGIPEDAFVVGHIGRFHSMKDHRSFLEAAAEVARRHSKVHFVMAGRAVSRDNRELAPWIEKHLDGRLHMLGERRDVAALLAAMDVLCATSAWGEGFPNVLGEAMATAVPCVTTTVGDSAEVVADTGLVVPPRDTRALVQALEDFLGMSADQRAKRGSAARKRIQEHYSIDAVLDRYRNLYEDLRGGSAAGRAVANG